MSGRKRLDAVETRLQACQTIPAVRIGQRPGARRARKPAENLPALGLDPLGRNGYGRRRFTAHRYAASYNGRSFGGLLARLRRTESGGGRERKGDKTCS
jgi:hypothetical protein